MERRRARYKELEKACRYLGFEIKNISADGLEQITPTGREENPENWQTATTEIKNLLDELRPQIIFFPHRKDKHPAHCGTNLLVSDALGLMPTDFTCLTIETEFWQALEFPNLMIEFDEQTVGDLVTALTFHVGEVKRNPYHLILPHWMIDNVRRGSEILTSPGEARRDFTFAGLYKASIFKQGKYRSAYDEGKFVSVAENIHFEEFTNNF